MKAWCVLTLLCAVPLPAAEYSTYIGGPNPISISRMISDSAGNVYIAGSRTFPSANNLSEAILIKLDPTGKTVLFANLSGKGNDVANAVALDKAGNIYLAGQTSSPDFPLHNALFSSPPASRTGYGFIAKFNSDASQILYSTYFPGIVSDVAADAAGNAYVTGTTTTSSFPVTTGLPAAANIGGIVPLVSGAFLTKISAAGDHILYSTVLSGYAKDCGCCSSCFLSDRGASGVAVALDGAGDAYVLGNSNVSDLPATPGALLATGVGPFVAKVNAGGTALSYLTYLGSGHQVVQPYEAVASAASALAVDASGNAYIAGNTWDPKLPMTPGAFQTTFHGWSQIVNLAPTPPNDAFACKLNPSGTALVWGSYLGGAGEDEATAAALDSAGNFWVAGATRSTEFPDAQGWSTGGDFIVAFNPSGAALPYSARYPDGTTSRTLALDAASLLHVATQNGVVSAVAAVPRPAIRPWLIGNAAGGTPGGQIAPGELVAIYGPHIGAFPPRQAANTSGIVPSVLGGAQVLFGDRPAPVLYSSDGQVNAVVPFEVSGQTTSRVRVVNQGETGPEFTAMVVASAPQVFQGSPGYAAALNEDGSINSADNPAKVGSVVSIWATGVYPPYPPVGDGQIFAGANDFECCAVFEYIYYLASQNYVKVLYAGAAPGLVAGVVQINFVAPASGFIGVSSGGSSSDPVRIFVKP
jgi:uncharacterized protein (TIGR03437 family)